ncbi:MAG: tetraacyldisaccharide 4'-kinase [Rhizobiales bacterium]|nr:tetraacyldisaccharide 4'-kinase [Hyphomicrobiales bacterium]
MRMPEFWSRQRSLTAQLLAPLGWLYGRITLARLKRRGEKLSVPVIAIGNFTAGGAGKTPVTLAIASALAKRGVRPFVVSRGYGGSESGPYRVDPLRDSSARVGDEPLMMARSFPVIVSRDRARGGKLALAQGADVILLDDALQNPDLEKDFTLGVVDGGFGFGNGFCVPAGPLRAPLAPMLARVDATLVIGADAAKSRDALAGKPCFSASIHVGSGLKSTLRGQRVLAYCGIGRPEKFGETLRECGAEIATLLAYGDHHAFTEDDAAHILSEAIRLRARPVTTEKDAARLVGSVTLEKLKAASLVVPIRIAPPDELLAMIYRAAASSASRASTASGEE